jgi:hypothetical protein
MKSNIYCFSKKYLVVDIGIALVERLNLHKIDTSGMTGTHSEKSWHFRTYAVITVIRAVVKRNFRRQILKSTPLISCSKWTTAFPWGT